MAKVILSSLIFAASLLTCAHIEKSQHRFSVAQQTPLSILQGLSWNEGALFTVLRQDSQKFTYFYTQDNSPGSSERLLIPKTYKYEDSDWVVDHFRIEFISKDPLSSLSDILIVRDQKRQVIDQRIISRPDLKKAHFKIALASCMDDRFEKEQRQIWQELLENKLDYLFLLGDNVYATSLLSPTEKMVSKSQLWQRYVETRQKLTLYHTKELIPTLAIWDDHDYGTRDGDKTYPFRQQAKEVFNAFYAQDQDIPGVFTLGPLNSALFKAFQGRFFLLDDRFQREPSGSDQGKYAHYGQEQEDWLFEGLAQSSAPSWLLMGDQFFGAYHPWDSFEGNHPKSFRQFLLKLRKISAPVVFVSGDRHLTEISRIQEPDLDYTTYELTSSPLHAKTYPSHWETKPNRRQLVGKDLKMNYMLIEGTLSAQHIEFQATSKSLNHEVLFSPRLTVEK